MVPSGHENNIFCAHFLSETNNTRAVSCGADGHLRVTDLQKSRSVKHFESNGMLMKVALMPSEPHNCVSTGQDGRVRLHDLRVRGHVRKLVDLESLNLSVASNTVFSPLDPLTFAVGATDMWVRLYDIRMDRGPDETVMKIAPPLSALLRSNTSKKRWSGGSTSMDIGASGLDINSQGQVLVNYRSAPMFLLSTKLNTTAQYPHSPVHSADEEEGLEDGVIQTYRGRQNSMTFLKEARFVLGGQSYVATGGDDGKLYIWDAVTGVLQRQGRGDGDALNTIAPHPTQPILCTGGIDDDAKVWECTLEEPLELPTVEIIASGGDSSSEEEESEDDSDVDIFAAYSDEGIVDPFLGTSDSDSDSDDAPVFPANVSEARAYQRLSRYGRGWGGSEGGGSDGSGSDGSGDDAGGGGAVGGGLPPRAAGGIDGPPAKRTRR